MSSPDRRTTDVLLTVALFVSLGVVIYSARRILLIFVLAVFFAYLINPVVKSMQTHSLFFRNLRGPAVVEVYIALVLLTATVGYAFAPRIATNTVKLVDKVPVKPPLGMFQATRAVKDDTRKLVGTVNRVFGGGSWVRRSWTLCSSECGLN